MTDYLAHRFPWDDPDKNWILDDVSQWSALCGGVLLREVPFPNSGAVLDLGSGFGFPALELAQRCGNGIRVVGIESWAAGVERSRCKAGTMGVTNAAFLRGDVLRLPLAGGAFRLVTANLLPNNIKPGDRAMLLRECRRVLAPGGRLAFATNLRGHMAEFYVAFSNAIAVEHDDESLARLTAHVDNRVSEDELLSLLEVAGFASCRFVRDEAVMRFRDGSAMLRHFLVKEAFLDDWRRIVAPEHEARIFARLEERLNEMAVLSGELRLTVPLLYAEAVRPS